MAGEWIKMRATLLTSPKVNGIARDLEARGDVCQALSKGSGAAMSQIVKRDVMRDVTLASLLRVWSSANEHTRDGIFRHADISDLDDIAGIPGFGQAMALVGWAVHDPENDCVMLPNFNEYNTSGKDRERSKAAERQRRYRQKRATQAPPRDDESNVTSNVTDNATSNDREEKRREENNSPPIAQAREAPTEPQAKSILSSGDPLVAASPTPADDGSGWPSGPDPGDRGGGDIEMALGAWQPGQAEVDALRIAGVALRIEAEDVAAFMTHYAGRWMPHHEIHRKFVKWMIRKKQYADERANTRGNNDGRTNTGHRGAAPNRSAKRWLEIAQNRN